MKKIFVLAVIVMLLMAPVRAEAQGGCPNGENWMVFNVGAPNPFPGVQLEVGQSVSITCINGVMYTQEKPFDSCFKVQGMKEGFLTIENVGKCVFASVHVFIGTIPEATELSFTKTPTATNTPSPTPRPTITETPEPTATEQSIVATENKISVQETKTTSTEQLPAKANIVIIAVALVLIAGILALVFKKKKNH